MTEGPNLLLELVQILAALAVVLGLAWVILRFGLPRLLGHGRSRGVPIEVLGVRPLDRQVKLAVVVAEGRRFLLAFGPGGVTALASRAVDEAAPTAGGHRSPPGEWSAGRFSGGEDVPRESEAADLRVGRGRSPEDGGEGGTTS